MGKQYEIEKFKITIPKLYKLKKKKRKTYYFESQKGKKLVLSSKLKINNNIFYKLRHPFKSAIDGIVFPKSKLYFDGQLGLFPLVAKSSFRKDDIVYKVKKSKFKAYILRRKSKEKYYLSFYLVNLNKSEEIYINTKAKIEKEKKVIDQLLSNIKLVK